MAGLPAHGTRRIPVSSEFNVKCSGASGLEGIKVHASHQNGAVPLQGKGCVGPVPEARQVPVAFWARPAFRTEAWARLLHASAACSRQICPATSSVTLTSSSPWTLSWIALWQVCLTFLCQNMRSSLEERHSHLLVQKLQGLPRLRQKQEDEDRPQLRHWPNSCRLRSLHKTEATACRQECLNKSRGEALSLKEQGTET